MPETKPNSIHAMFTRRELRLINFALVHTFLLSKTHYAKDLEMAEFTLIERVSQMLSSLEAEIDPDSEP